MPVNVFGNSYFPSEKDNKIDTSLFVQKHYLRTNYIESNMGEDIDMKNQYRNKIIPNRVSTGETASKKYDDTLCNDPSKIENTTHVDFNDKNIHNVRCVKVNFLPSVPQDQTAKHYVDDAIDEILLVRNNKDRGFNFFNLTNNQFCFIYSSSY